MSPLSPHLLDGGFAAPAQAHQEDPGLGAVWAVVQARLVHQHPPVVQVLGEGVHEPVAPGHVLWSQVLDGHGLKVVVLGCPHW